MRNKFTRILMCVCMICSVFMFNACSDNETVGDHNYQAVMLDANHAVFQYSTGLKFRASNVDVWNDDHSDVWVSKLTFDVPAGAVDVTKPNFDKSGSVYYVPADFSGDLDLQWLALNDGAKFYNYGTVTAFNNVNFNGVVTFYNAGTLTYSVSSGQRHTIINTGNLTINNYGNVGEVYNNGLLVLAKTYNPWWNDPNAKADVPDAMSIYSIDGVIECPDETDLKANLDVHNMIYASENIKIQNTKTQYVCGLSVAGTLDVTHGKLETSYVKAKEITFDGAELWLTKEAYVGADKMSMPNSATSIHGYSGSYALVEVGEIAFQNTNNFNDSFSSNVYVKVAKDIDFNNSTLFGGQAKHYAGVADYLVDFPDDAARFNADKVAGKPACGEPYGDSGNVPPTTPEVEGPSLELIGSIEAPTHDHDIDKDVPNRPHLSATCIDFANGVFYVSYHMRGGNYAGDTYDKDGVEGCIESYTITKEKGSDYITLGNWMWTNDFDFNHLIIDGSDIVTVGHYGNNGAIIGRMPNVFQNFDAVENNGAGYSTEFTFKYLTTNVPLMGDGKNGEIRIDYLNAGDGNCVIKVGSEYFVATYAGYGRLDKDFNKLKDFAGDVLFTPTPYSAKHIVKNGNNVAVLYLNDAPTAPLTATTSSTASVVIVDKFNYPFGGATVSTNSYVQPVDGKNVLAVDDNKVYACLGKGGLSVDGTIYNFGKDGAEPVNGIAIDSKYVYLATGSHLRVLDKSTMEEVTHYAIPYMSANYIKLAEVDGEKYIAVAFGQAGIKVFKLND